jgi:hypothetical protein
MPALLSLVACSIVVRAYRILAPLAVHLFDLAAHPSSG